MRQSERDLLFHKKGAMHTHISVRLAAPLSVCFLSYFAIWINQYAVNEWIQHTIKLQMFGNETLNRPSTCTNDSTPEYTKLEKVQQESARWQIYITLAKKGVSLVTTFLFTVYTDVLGRRFLFILSSFSISIYFLLEACVVLFSLDFIYLVLSSIVYALTGTSYGLMAVSYSYIADITTEGKQRAQCIFAMDVSISIGGTAGGLVAGYFIEGTGFVYPSFVAAGVSTLALIIAIVCVPESLKEKDKIVRPPLKQSMTRPFQFYISKNFKGYRLLYLMLVFSFVFSDMTGVHRKGIETLYQLGMPFCWSPSKIGIFATINSSAATIFGTLFVKVTQNLLSTVTIALISIATTAGSFVLEALASTDVMLYLVAVPACLCTIPSSMIRGTMSTMTSKQNQGALAAGLLVVQTLFSFVSGYVDNSVYAATLPFFNGFVFLVFAFYCVLTVIFLLAYIVIKRRRDNSVSVINVTSEDLKRPEDGDSLPK